MSRGSDARRERRRLKSAGVATMHRVAIENAALAAAVTNGADLVDLVAFHVAEALGELDAKGADVMAHTVVTIGAHPDFPGALTIEAKASSLKAGVTVVDDCDCPVDHSEAQLGDDDA